jgi:hypothetical protein
MAIGGTQMGSVPGAGSATGPVTQLRAPTLEQIGTGVQTGVTIYQGIQQIGSGGDAKDCKGRRWCPGRPADEQIAAVLLNATANELQRFRAGWAKEPGGSVPLEAANPCDVGYWLWGHADCQHSGANGNADRDTMLTLVQRYAPAGGLLTPYPVSTGGLPPAGNGQSSTVSSGGTPISGCIQVGNTQVCGQTGGTTPKPTFTAGIGFGLDNILIIGIVILAVVLLAKKL